MSSLPLLREFWRSEQAPAFPYAQFDSVTMNSMTEESEVGPRLLQKYLNTNRRDFKVVALLDELDMKDTAERAEFQQFLKEFMAFDPETNTGYQKKEIANLDDAYMRSYAEQFMDKTKFLRRKWAVGITYFPPPRLEGDPHTSSHRKKWNYERNRLGIIAAVTQIMITQRNNIKKQRGAKRARSSEVDSAGSQQQERRDQSDDEYIPPSVHSLKRLRKPIASQRPALTTRLASQASGSPCSAIQATEPNTEPPGGPCVADSSKTQIPTANTIDLPQIAPEKSILQHDSHSLSPSLSRPQTSSHNNLEAHDDSGGIRAVKSLAVQGMMMTADLGNGTCIDDIHDQVKIQYFTAGRQHARKHFAFTCMETQLAAKMMEGPQAAFLVQKAQGLFDALHDFDKTMQEKKDSLPETTRSSEDVLERLKLFYFKAGLEYARKHFMSACMEMQLSARSVQGFDAEFLAQKSQGIFDALYDLSKLLQEDNMKLQKIVRKVDLE